MNLVCRYLITLYALRSALYLHRRKTKKNSPPPTPRGHVLVFILQMGLEPTIPSVRARNALPLDLTYSQSLHIRPILLAEQHTRLTG